MTGLLLAVAAGAVIGLSLGALGGGGSILAVPVLLALGQSAAQATTGSLVVVGVTSIAGAVTARRAGSVLLARGAVFGVVAIGGAIAGAHLSARVPGSVLLAAFSALMLLVAGLMTARLLQSRRGAGRSNRIVEHPRLDDPIITFSPAFMCQCPRALKVLVTASVVGLLTGFLGVGGGFLVGPALALALALPMRYAAGTSLVVITITSAAALAARAGAGIAPDWGLVAALTLTSVVGSVVGVRVAARSDSARLSAAFTGLVLTVAAYVAVQALPALV